MTHTTTTLSAHQLTDFMTLPSSLRARFSLFRSLSLLALSPVRVAGMDFDCDGDIDCLVGKTQTNGAFASVFSIVFETNAPRADLPRPTSIQQAHLKALRGTTRETVTIMFGKKNRQTSLEKILVAKLRRTAVTSTEMGMLIAWLEDMMAE